MLKILQLLGVQMLILFDAADIVAVNLEARALYYDFWIIGGK